MPHDKTTKNNHGFGSLGEEDVQKQSKKNEKKGRFVREGLFD